MRESLLTAWVLWLTYTPKAQRMKKNPRKKTAKKSRPPSSASRGPAKAPSPAGHSTVQNWLTLGQLRAEKCELAEAKIAFNMALTQAKRHADLRSMMEAI